MVPRKLWVYNCVKAVLFTSYKIFFRFQYFGSGNVPPASDPRGVILAPNHASYLDPPILGISLNRPVIYLAKDYLFKAFFIGSLLRAVSAFPILTKADDFRSIRGLLRILREGECVVVFPEGTRSPHGDLQEPESGLGFLALKSKAWVVPVYIEGTYEAFPRHAKFIRPHPVKVYYGRPFIPAEEPEILNAGDAYAAVTRKVMAEIKRLKERKYNE